MLSNTSTNFRHKTFSFVAVAGDEISLEQYFVIGAVVKFVLLTHQTCNSSTEQNKKKMKWKTSACVKCASSKDVDFCKKWTVLPFTHLYYSSGYFRPSYLQLFPTNFKCRQSAYFGWFVCYRDQPSGGIRGNSHNTRVAKLSLQYIIN